MLHVQLTHNYFPIHVHVSTSLRFIPNDIISELCPNLSQSKHLLYSALNVKMTMSYFYVPLDHKSHEEVDDSEVNTYSLTCYIVLNG